MVAYDASNPKHIAKASRRARSAEAASALYLRSAMATPEGRSWFFHLLERCHVFHQPFTSNALTTAFNCGEMNIGQQVLVDVMTFCPDQYLLMMREHNDGGTASNDRHLGREQNTDRRDNDATSNGAAVVSDYNPIAADDDRDETARD